MDSLTIPIIRSMARPGVPGSTIYAFDVSALDHDQANDLLVDLAIRLSEISDGTVSPSEILLLAATTGRDAGF